MPVETQLSTSLAVPSTQPPGELLSSLLLLLVHFPFSVD